ncbi:hypothetical protein AVEN_168369-1 [Araneus ventricosus]|uniref:DDE-1 domain-containing protein n=1 Tax=Araneus ventricosus TaxID=182803 RepID=A0A4Y2NWB7_ARAVE|nr:hypothetical protein AVEN_168369-1 [Araneus ventricosus]
MFVPLAFVAAIGDIFYDRIWRQILVCEARGLDARRSLVLEIWRNFKKFRFFTSPDSKRLEAALKFSFIIVDMKNYKIKTDGSTTPQETFLETAGVVITICSLRKAAGKYGMNSMTFRDTIVEFKLLWMHLKIFTDEQETELKQYIDSASKLYYGLYTKKVKSLAYKVYDRSEFYGQGVYNVDETGLTKVQNPRKTTAMNGTKRVGTVTTIERGSLVTMALVVSANGNSVPPFFSSRKIFKRHFRSSVHQGNSGSSNKSVWMTGQDFQSSMTHFIKHARFTKERTVLLILDNHQSISTYQHWTWPKTTE